MIAGESTAARSMVVDAFDEAAAQFYARHGAAMQVAYHLASWQAPWAVSLLETGKQYRLGFAVLAIPGAVL